MKSTGKKLPEDTVEMTCAVCTKCYRLEHYYQRTGIVACQYGGPFSGYEEVRDEDRLQ